jgi:HupE/UreJ protein
LTTLILVLSYRPSAHDLPSEVTVQGFVKTADRHVQLLIRVPLVALVNMNLPKRGPGYLDLEHIESALRDIATATADAVEVYEGDTRLTDSRIGNVRVSLPSDKSFGSYEEAVAYLTGPVLPVATDVFWNQGFFDAVLEYPIQSNRSDFSIRARLTPLAGRVITVLRFLPTGGGVRTYELVGDPGIVRFDPRWHHAALLFVKSGSFHILDGTDHLLFLFCLVIPFRRFRALIPVVTSFTVAHSITLIAASYDITPGGAWFPPLIETLIAISIVYMALENIVAADLRRRWMIAFAFGLVHGFGFSFALRQTLQFAGAHLLTSLVSFNVGVELGQILVLALFIPALILLFRFVVSERLGVIILSALVAHTGWHWVVERAGPLRQVEWPLLTFTIALQWLTALSLIVYVSWLAFVMLWRRPESGIAAGPATEIAAK